MKQKLHKSFLKGLFKTLSMVWLFAILCTSSGFAQTTVEIGTGTSIDNSLPMDPYFHYSYSQSIYLPSEINQSGEITKLRYHYNGNSSWTDNIVVYMGHTTATEFADNSSWIDITSLTEVYNGPFALTTIDGWVEIVLSTLFDYNNTDNLVIAVDENTYAYHSMNDHFYNTATTGNMSIEYHLDGISSDADPANPPTSNATKTRAFRPNIQLEVASFIPNDAGIAFITPAGEFAAGVKDVTATIKNYGVDNLTSATISWSVDGVAQTDYSWAGTLLKGETAQVVLGSYDFSTPATYSIIASTSVPNTVADENAANDALTADVTSVTAIVDFPFFEDFNADATIPAGWVNETDDEWDWKFVSSVSDNAGTIGSDNSGSGNFALFDSWNASEGKIAKLTTPLLDLSVFDNATLEFYWQRAEPDDWGRLEVNVLYNGVWYNDLVTGLNYEQTSWELITLDLTPYISTGAKVQFKVKSDYSKNIAFDDVKITGTVIAPNDAGIASIDVPGAEFAAGVKDVTATIQNFGTTNLTQATISWSIDGVAQTDYSWTGDLVQGATEQLVLGSFDFSTEATYAINISTSMPNGVADENIMNDVMGIDAVSITPISVFPWIEDFENAGVLPTGWSLTSSSNMYWDFVYDDASHGADSIENGSGYFARMDTYSTEIENNPICLISPIIELAAGSFMHLEYYAWIGNSSETNPLYIDISTDGKTTWTAINTHDHSTTNSWFKNDIDLTDYAGNDVFIRFRAVSNYGSNSCNINLDDIRIYQPTAMEYSSSTTAQTIGAIPIGEVGNVIGIEVNTSGQANFVSATQFVLNTNGTTDAINDIENARLWYTGSSSVYDTTLQFGTDFISPDGEFIINGNQSLEEGTNHFWLTYNINDAATKGNFVDAECNSVSIDSAGVSTTYVPDVMAPVGNNEIIVVELMPSGTGNTITSCGFTMFDDGGLTGDYSNNFNGEVTLYPITPGDAVKIDFAMLRLDGYNDSLYIYNGNSTSVPLIEVYNSYNYDTFGTIESSAPDGSLTLKFVTGSSGSDLGWDANVTCYTPDTMIYVSSTTTQNIDLVSYNTPNAQIIGIEVVTTGRIPAQYITEFALNTEGSINPADIDAARIWYTGTSNVFDMTTQFGADVVAPDGQFSINGSTNLLEGTNYFWLVYDIAADAGRDNFIDAQCDSILIDGAYRIPAIVAPMGYRIVERTMNMQEGINSVTACDMIFYDEGGATGSYSNLFDGTTTFYPSTPGAGIRIEFLECDLGEFTDVLAIHNGASTAAPVLAELDYQSVVTTVFESTSPDGSLTLYLDGDGYDDTQATGWKAKVSCYTMEEMAYDTIKLKQKISFATENSINNNVMAIEVSTTGYSLPLNITEFALNTSGSDYPFTDIENAKLWYTGTDSVFTTNNQFGTDAIAPNGAFTINGNQDLASGKNYFWLTYDIKAGATLGNVVDAECNSFTINGNVETPGVTSAQGNTTISQFYTMTGIGQEITDCGYILTDDGGIDGNYSYGFEGVVTLYPNNPTDVVVVDFISFEMKMDNDHYLNVYNGDTVRTNSELGSYSYYTEDPGEFISTALDGSLTLKFVSDASTLTPVYAGFIANVFCMSSDATLSDITIGGTSLTGFAPGVYTYDVILPNGTNTIPVVDYVLNDARATVNTNAAVNTPGSVEFTVTAENGNSNIYTINFTEELAPTAVNVMVLGTAQAGQTLTALYDYYDENGALEGVTTFKWYRADDDQGLNKTEIADETTLTYTLVEADNGKYVTFEVTPVALTGMLTGIAVEATVGPILPPPSLENSMLTFDFNGLDPVVTGNVDETTFIVTLIVPYGTDLVTLVPTITISDNATVSPASDVEQDFTNDVVYTVTAENGDEQPYTVSITIAQNTENSILTFDFNELDPAVIGSIDEVSHIVTLLVPYGTDLATLVPSLTISDNATVSPASDVEQDFTNDVVYTVTAENGDEQPYTVSVTVESNTDNKVMAFTFEELDPVVEADEIDHTKSRINITVPYGTDITALVPTIVVSTNANISPATGVAQDFTNTVEYVVTAENGDERNYTVNLTIAPNHENSILTFDFEEFDPKVIGVIEDNTITLSVNAGADVSALRPTITLSAEATVTPASGEIQDFTNDVVYTVTAQNSDVKEYIVKVNFNTGIDNEIISISDINLYPNPSNGRFKLVISTEESEEYDVEIINIQGKVIFESKIINEKDIDMTEFAKGIYYVRVSVKDNVVTKKILIQ
jgi:hypothetical protein